MISSSVAERDSLLFVYGTLRPCSRTPVARWLGAHACYLGPARTRGRLYDLGHFPGLRAPRSLREWVSGDLYVLPRAAMLRTLDRYETAPHGRGLAPFERVRCSVELQRNMGRARRHIAWAYVYRRSIMQCARIRSGDYLHCASAIQLLDALTSTPT